MYFCDAQNTDLFYIWENTVPLPHMSKYANIKLLLTYDCLVGSFLELKSMIEYVL